MAKIDEEMKFTIMNVEGEEVECEVLFTFDSEETNKSYIVYTDNAIDEKGNTKVYASTYDTTGEFASLQSIETDKEWKIIETILETLQEEIAGEDEADVNIELWISEMEKQIDDIEENDEFDLSPHMSQIVDKLMDEDLMDYTELLFSLLKKAQKKTKLNYVSNVDLGMKAYQQKIII